MLKTKGQVLNEELVAGLAGKFVHVPTNIHKVPTPTGAITEANVWFAGRVAGYEKAVLSFEYETGTFFDEPKQYFNLLLTDGMGYVLTAENDLEIIELTEEEFERMVEEHRKEQEANAEVPLPEEDQKLTLVDGGQK